MAERRVRESLPEGMFDTLPEEAKQAIINDKQAAIETAERHKEHLEYVTTQVNRIERMEQWEGENFSKPIRVGGEEGDEGNKVVPLSQGVIDINVLNNEHNPVNLLDGRIIHFRKQTILNLMGQLKEIINETKEHKDVCREPKVLYVVLYLEK